MLKNKLNPSAFKMTAKTAAILIGLAMSTSACTTYTNSKDGKDESSSATTTFNVNKYPIHKTVCEPFGDDPVKDLQSGVKADLFYRGSGQDRWYTVDEYISLGKNSTQSLFFSQINVPTRIFSLGFPTETGGIVTTDDNQALHEYFALQFTGRLRLGADQEPGTYELALLSDDGTILSFQQSDGSYKVAVNNDGDHPTRFGCGETIEMTKDSLVNFNLKYYQGPRWHISVIPMWRKIDSTTAKDPLCGKLGNELYFDYDKNSEPQKAYKDLLARGWQPWGFENYLLPSDDDHNPCYEGVAPRISEVLIDYDLDRGLILAWQTDIPATSQVLVKNVSTGAEELTVSDNVLRTSHEITFGLGLASGDYEFRPVSISDTYGKTVGDPIPFTAR